MNQKTDYAIIGEFVSKVNSFELLVNVTLEMIINHHTVGKNVDSSVTSTIEFIQQQSIRQRVDFIILLIHTSSLEESKAQEYVDGLKEFSKYYNKSIRDYRDFIAHNPVLNGLGKVSVVSSRIVSNKKVQHVELSYIEKANTELNGKLDEVFKLLVAIQKSFPSEVSRIFGHAPKTPQP